MSDLRSQINSLSAAEKAELLDTVWENLEADAASLTDAQRRSLITASLVMSKTLPMSSRGSKSGRACLRNRDTAGRLVTRGKRRLVEARAWYDNIRPELGERFALAVEATVEAIADNPFALPCRPPEPSACGSAALSLRNILRGSGASDRGNCLLPRQA